MNLGRMNENEEKSERSIPMEILCTSNLMKRCIDFSPTKQRMDSVTGIHGRIITFLYRNGDRDIFQKDVEEKFSYRRSTASTVIGLMEEKGLVERRSVPSDARLKKLVLTPKAVELAALVEKDRHDFDCRMREGISESELEVFFSVMDKVKENLEKTGVCKQHS